MALQLLRKSRVALPKLARLIPTSSPQKQMAYLINTKDKDIKVKLLSELPENLPVVEANNHRSIYKQVQAEFRYEPFTFPQQGLY